MQFPPTPPLLPERLFLIHYEHGVLSYRRSPVHIWRERGGLSSLLLRCLLRIPRGRAPVLSEPLPCACPSVSPSSSELLLCALLSARLLSASLATSRCVLRLQRGQVCCLACTAKLESPHISPAVLQVAFKRLSLDANNNIIPV